ncbi:hypothetical protein EXIGLDRAFT_429684 [Exidia glandulosa HHB12029]|uniref:Uncharacterized protein n=1 Tax=Exidia glandulosa HHB12029 TaxID=1314781 RepID=A0A165BBG4_EXIGL|nr:hypothetical protein EXIGLDRAFT_429684 [Exidia glandulosa HHB12029]
MTSRPALSSRRRPSSAIFLGNPPPDLPSPPSPASNSSGEDLPSSSKRGAHLPSPPHTNSTGSKSSTGSGSVRVTTANLMDSAQRRRSFASDGDGDEDDEQNERDEDDTARLSDDRRKQTDGNQRSVQRVKSLTERNRFSTRLLQFLLARDLRRHRLQLATNIPRPPHHFRPRRSPIACPSRARAMKSISPAPRRSARAAPCAMTPPTCASTRPAPATTDLPRRLRHRRAARANTRARPALRDGRASTRARPAHGAAGTRANDSSLRHLLPIRPSGLHFAL